MNINFALRNVLAAAVILLAADSAAAAHTAKILHTFANQEQSFGSLVMDGAGNLYGTTSAGGAHGGGTVFEMKRHGKNYDYKVLYDFCSQTLCADGSGPNGTLVIDTVGNLYGVTQTISWVFHPYGGTAYKLTPNAHGSWTFTLLHSFCPENTIDCADGSSPSSLDYAGEKDGLAYDGASPLYGVTQLGGASQLGFVFTLTPPSESGDWSYSALYNFCSSGCATPFWGTYGLIVDGSGNILGAATAGGVHGQGVVYELSASGPHRRDAWSVTVLHDFCAEANCVDGRYANSLIMDASGNLIGTTYSGGLPDKGGNGAGLIFKLTPDGGGWDYSILHLFCAEGRYCKNGEDPTGPLVMDGSGTLYGTTYSGGNRSNIKHDHETAGTLFALGADYTVIHRFCELDNCSDGKEPNGSLVRDPLGHLFGITFRGGSNADAGVVYQVNP